MKTSSLVFAFVALVCQLSCSETGMVHPTAPDGGDASVDGGVEAAGGAASTGGATAEGTGGTAAGGEAGGQAGRGISGSLGGGGAAGAAGVTGQAGRGGSAGSPGVVGFRIGSYRATAPASLEPPHTTLQLPPSIQGQDGLLLAQIVGGSLTTSNAESLGFKLVATATAATSPTLVLQVFWKVAAGPAGQPTTDPATLTVTNSRGGYQSLILLAVHGFDPTAPIVGSTTAGGDTAELSAPGLSVTRPGSLGLFWKASLGSGTITTPNDWTIVVRGQDGTNDVLWRSLGVGPTKDVTAAQSAPSPWVSALVVIQPP